MRPLRELRQEKKLSLEDISSLTGLTVPHLSLIERGKIVPNVHTKIRLQRIFGNKIDFMVMDDDFVKSDYMYCEHQYKYLIIMIKAMPEEIRYQYCTSAIKHLKMIQRKEPLKEIIQLS